MNYVHCFYWGLASIEIKDCTIFKFYKTGRTPDLQIKASKLLHYLNVHCSSLSVDSYLTILLCCIEYQLARVIMQIILCDNYRVIYQ